MDNALSNSVNVKTSQEVKVMATETLYVDTVVEQNEIYIEDREPVQTAVVAVCLSRFPTGFSSD